MIRQENFSKRIITGKLRSEVVKIRDGMKERPLSEQKVKGQDNQHTLVLFNDEYNTFEHVIKSLVEVCGHDPVQAEQCAIITHFKGSCDVKSGSLSIINAMHKGLVVRDLASEIKS